MEIDASAFKAFSEVDGYVDPRLSKEFSVSRGIDRTFQTLFAGVLNDIVKVSDSCLQVSQDDVDKDSQYVEHVFCGGMWAISDMVVVKVNDGMSRADMADMLSMSMEECNPDELIGTADKNEALTGIGGGKGIEKTIIAGSEEVMEIQTSHVNIRSSSRDKIAFDKGEKTIKPLGPQNQSVTSVRKTESNIVVSNELQAQAAAPQSNTANMILSDMKVENEPYSQIGREIKFGLEKKGPMEFTMQLEPKNLGEIDVKLRIKEGKLIIDIMAANQKTHALLTGQVDKLVMSLGLQNVLVERVHIDKPLDVEIPEGENLEPSMNNETDFSNGKQQNQLNQRWIIGQNSIKAVGRQYGNIEISHSNQDGYQISKKTDFAGIDYLI